jgi:hypothetical protein
MQPDLIGKTLLVLRDTGVLVDREVARSWDLEKIARVEHILTQHIAPGYTGTLPVNWVSPEPEDWAGEVQYLWGLAGPRGAAFTLIKLPHHTRGQLERAKRILRHTRDVAQMNTIHVKQWLELDLSAELDKELLKA